MKNTIIRRKNLRKMCIQHKIQQMKEGLIGNPCLNEYESLVLKNIDKLVKVCNVPAGHHAH